MCVCVCVCVSEGERERESAQRGCFRSMHPLEYDNGIYNLSLLWDLRIPGLSIRTAGDNFINKMP